MAIQINNNLLRMTLENSEKRKNIVYEDITIHGHVIKDVPVKKDPYTSENILSGSTIKKISTLIANSNSSDSELIYN